MGYENLQKIDLVAGVDDGSDYLELDAAAAITLSLVPSANEKIWVYGFGCRLTEAVVASGFNTTAPVAALSLDAANAGSPVEKSTITFALNTAYAVGKEVYGTDFVPFVVSGAAGDSLEVSIKTQGAGQTTTGEAHPFILAYTEHLLDGA